MTAIEKINAEMQKNADDAYTEIIGHYIIDRCDNADVAARVGADGKTLSDAMSAVISAARKKQKNNCAVLLPNEVFGEVDKYFGIPTNTAAQEAAMRSAAGAPANAAEGSVLSLTDFM